MCGIAGELNFKGACRTDVLERMLGGVRYRGPDYEAIYCDEAIGLAHARLSIIDLSAAGNQPMRDCDDDLALVFNGVIYNYRVLMEQLIACGYQFFSCSDSEVILKAYRHWGQSCINKLEGIFAFGIWDRRRRTLFLARDRFGIKPLYYTRNNEHFRFASTPQALLAAGDINTEINPVALHHHLTLHAVVPAPLTLFKGIQKLQPAHSLAVDADGKMKTSRYWQLHPARGVPHDEDGWLKGLEDRLLQAVKVRYETTDVPTGVLLSGGLDSSLVVALLRQINVPGLNTYSIGFECRGDESGNEFRYSDQIAEHFQTEHHRFKVADSVLLENLSAAVQYMAEPMVGQDCIGFYLLAERVSQDIKVVQSGQGADEVFGGYFWYRLMNDADGSDVGKFAQFYFDRPHSEYLEGVTSAYRIEDPTTPMIEALLETNRRDSFVNTVLSMDATTLIVDDPVKRVDNMTMAWGLEARVPFLDPKVVEYALAMSAELKLRDSGKYPLKQLARKYLPASVIDRPKAYFPVPALQRLGGQFLHLADSVLNSEACVQRGLFSREYVAKLLTNPQSYTTPIRGSKLWHYVLLEMWLQSHLR